MPLLIWSFPRHPLSCASPNNSRPEMRRFYCLSPPTTDVGSREQCHTHGFMGSHRTKSLSARELPCVWKSSIPVIGCRFSHNNFPCGLYMAWCKCQLPSGCTEPSPCTSPQTGAHSLFQPVLDPPYFKISFRVQFPASQPDQSLKVRAPVGKEFVNQGREAEG